MTTYSRLLAGVVIAGGIVLAARPSAAAPISQSLALKSGDVSIVETVKKKKKQYHARGRAYPPAYYGGSYGPGYARGLPTGRYACPPGGGGDPRWASGFPSWSCEFQTGHW